ncbi:hypothetical protein ACBI99_07325 [Nonomuraea sp. ATR24]|uniref:hypothetical protein n=1 Tax=unclassified Nonomuraea TaxID=2593643 RepID=UPI0033F948A0
MRALPEESQWGLLAAAGLAEQIHAFWFEGDDRAAIAAELGIDQARTVECGLATALRWNGAGSRTPILWMGRHAPGWTFALVLNFSLCALAPLDRRVLEFCYVRGINEFYGVPGIYGEDGLDDLWLNDDQGDESDLDPHLVAIGRITGRFVDRAWLAERRTLCRVAA